MFEKKITNNNIKNKQWCLVSKDSDYYVYALQNENDKVFFEDIDFVYDPKMQLKDDFNVDIQVLKDDSVLLQKNNAYKVQAKTNVLQQCLYISITALAIKMCFDVLLWGLFY